MNATRSRALPRLLWVSPELAPYASVGGLGEVVAALAQELHAAGWPLAVLLPRYRTLAVGREPAVRRQHPLTLQLGPHRYQLIVHEASTERGLTLFLLDCPELFDREGIYGPTAADAFSDNHLRFGLLNLVACELIRTGLWPTDILHVHDWPASLSLAMLATWYREVPEFADLRSVLSIHNLLHAGRFESGVLAELGLPPWLAQPQWMGHAGEVSWLKGAIRCADQIFTVSPSYAREITTAAHGCGLDDVLRERAGALRGILNGIDISEWDPATDPQLAAPYSALALAGKARCKAALQRELALEVSSAPLLVFVGRLVEQKGIDLLLQALPALLQQGVQLAVCGSGERQIERALLRVADLHPRSVGVHIGFDRDLAHRLLAGGDILLMPSRFEPCGITQMQAMRYGTVPVVHGVGGLRDTVEPVTSSATARDKGTGFVFRSFTPRALSLAVGKALLLYRQPSHWQSVMRRGMERDWSWAQRRPLYERLLKQSMRTTVHRFELEIPVVAPKAAAAPQSLYIDWGPELPARYQVDVLRLMVQSPRQLYAYWEIASSRWQGLAKPVSLELLGEGGATTLVAAVDELGEWWLQALPDHEYRIVLRDAHGALLLESNVVHTPREQESLRRDVQWIASEERLLRFAALSGRAEPEAASQRRYSGSQRKGGQS